MKKQNILDMSSKNIWYVSGAGGKVISACALWVCLLYYMFVYYFASIAICEKSDLLFDFKFRIPVSISQGSIPARGTVVGFFATSPVLLVNSKMYINWHSKVPSKKTIYYIGPLERNVRNLDISHIPSAGITDY